MLVMIKLYLAPKTILIKTIKHCFVPFSKIITIDSSAYWICLHQKMRIHGCFLIQAVNITTFCFYSFFGGCRFIQHGFVDYKYLQKELSYAQTQKKPNHNERNSYTWRR